MASLVPASLSYSGGTLRTSRIVPARLTYVGGSAIRTRTSPLSTAAVIPVLDRLTVYDKPAGVGDTEWHRQVAIWQSAMEAIEEAFAAVNARVDEVALYARLQAVETLAQAANDNATVAKQTVEQASAAVQETFQQIDPVYADYYESRLLP